MHSLATPMRYKLRLGGGPAVRGRALAHFEKDRGISFPSSWHWAQGINASWSEQAEGAAAGAAAASGEAGCRPAADLDSDEDASAAALSCGPVASVNGVFTLAGGPPPTPLPVPEGWLPDVWLLGVRTRTRRWAGGAVLGECTQLRRGSMIGWSVGHCPPSKLSVLLARQAAVHRPPLLFTHVGEPPQQAHAHPPSLPVHPSCRSWDFRPYDSVFTSQAKPCKSELVLTATQPLAQRAVEVQVRGTLRGRVQLAACSWRLGAGRRGQGLSCWQNSQGACGAGRGGAGQ